MKGTTHLAIGLTIGAAAAAYYPFTIMNAAAYVTVAGISALSADLDGPSLISSSISKFSKLLYGIIQAGGWLLLGTIIYLYVYDHYFNGYLTIIAASLILTGLVVNQGIIRNSLVSLLGTVLIYAGFIFHLYWLIGFGAFIVCAPWFKHRGMTHTIWAVIAWTAIGYGLEQYLAIDGIMRVAFLGYFSHLLADTLTPNGVKWLYPIVKKSFKL